MFFQTLASVFCRAAAEVIILFLTWRIRHNNGGIGPGWHLEKITIKSNDNRTWLCMCNRWLAKDKDDGAIERDLEAIEMETNLGDESDDDDGNF